MKSLHKIRKPLNDQGVAMIYTLIVGAVIMVFCLSLLFLSYSLLTQADRQTHLMKCKEYAQSLALEISQEVAEVTKKSGETEEDNSVLGKYLLTKIEALEKIKNEGNPTEDPDSKQDQKLASFQLVADGSGSSPELEDYRVLVEIGYEAMEDEEGEDEEEEKASTSSYEIVITVHCERGPFSYDATTTSTLIKKE